ncbi:hypothetical protein ACK1GS_003516 [Salmonella enterica]
MRTGYLLMKGNHCQTQNWRGLQRQFLLLTITRHSRKHHFSDGIFDVFNEKRLR